MVAKFMGPAGVNNLLRMAREGVPPPPEIVSLKEEIARRTNAAEVRVSVTGEVDMSEVENIAKLKFQLDALYAAWGEGAL